MDEDSDSTNWVLVSEVDCAEEALELNPSVSTISDSDQESDGSISIISDHPTDSYSEEEHEKTTKIKQVDHSPSIKLTDLDSSVLIKKEDDNIQVQQIESSTSVKENRVEDVSRTFSEDLNKSHETSDWDVSSTSESTLSKRWIYMDEKSKLELGASRRPFYLDFSQEPILEISPNETEIDTESSASVQECQTIAGKQEMSITNISNKDSCKKIGISILISMMVLIGAHLIQQYLAYQDDIIQCPTESFLEGLADNEKAREIIDFCMARQKSKGEYSEHAVEKCVIKKLRKKNREDSMKKTEIYLKMKERILELREKELVEKEKEILRKWRKRSSSNENIEAYKKKGYYGTEQKRQTEESEKNYKEFDNKFGKQSNYKGKKKHEHQTNYPKKGEKENWDENMPSSFRTKNHWKSQKIKEVTEKKPKKDFSENDYFNKKFKKHHKVEEETLNNFKEKVKKSFQGNTLKQTLKNLKEDLKEDPNKEWYIKYNPILNTLEVINITTLPEQDSLLIKNGNKTVNGQWYFSLYGVSRTHIRNKEKIAEWYFKRAHFRENKRDKAKWYFDYMSARENTRQFECDCYVRLKAFMKRVPLEDKMMFKTLMNGFRL